MGCKHTVSPHPPMKNHSVKCLTFEDNIRKPYEDNLCLFRALALHLHGNEKLEEETCKLFNLFLEKIGGTVSASFRGVCMEDFSAVEDVVQADIILYDIDVVDEPMIGEPAKGSLGKYSNTVRLLPYSSHICDVSSVQALLKAYRCPSCDHFINRAQHLDWLLTTRRERICHVFPKNVFQLRETLFDNIDSCNIPYSDDQKLIKNAAIFDLYAGGQTPRYRY